MKKARFFKIALLIAFITLLFISAGTFLVFHYFPKDKILTIIATRAEKILKRKVIIQGIDYGFQGITLNNIAIYNNLSSDNGKDREEILASVDDVNIQLSLLPLLKKEIIINKIILDKFKIILSYNNGKSNLDDFIKDIKNSGSPDIETKISAMEFKDAEITLKDAPEIVKPLEGRYVFNGTLNIMSDSLYLISDSDVVLPENRGNISTDNFVISISKDDFEITGDCMLQSCQLGWVYKWDEEIERLLLYKNFTGQTRIRITSNIVEVDAKGKSDLPNMRTASVDGKCRVDMARETVSLLNIKANVRNSAFLINEILLSYNDNVKDAVLRFKITDIDADISDIKPVLSFFPQDIMENIFGEGSGWISYDNNMYSGKLNLKNATYRKNEKNILKINSEISVDNNAIYLDKLPIYIYDQPCTVSISTSGKNFEKIILNLYAKDYNYIPDKNDNTKYNFSNVKIDSQISGRIDIDNLNVDKYNFSSVAINYSFAGSHLNINQVNGKFMGGNIKGNGLIDISGKSPYLDLSTDFEEIKVQNIVNLNSELSGRFFGIARGNANIEFGLENNGSIFDTLKGKMEFNIDKGKLVNTGIQKGLGIWLSELKYKLSNIEFNKIYGNFNITGNNCHINSMLFNAPDIRLKLDGSFTAPFDDQKKMPGDMKILLEFNDFFIQDIPNLPQAQFITKLLQIPALKKRGDWYTMSFQDKGDDITDGKNIKPL